MRASQKELEVSAHNVANLNTEGFEADRVVSQEQQAGGVRAVVVPTQAAAPVAVQEDGSEQLLSNTGLAQETVNQIQGLRAFEANLATLRAADALSSFLVNIRK